LLILPVIFCFAGCSEEQLGGKNKTVRYQYVYKGGNSAWCAEYRYDGEGRFTEENGHLGFESWSTEELLVLYKNNISELSDVKNLKISYQVDGGSGSLEMNSLEDGPMDKIYRFHSSSSGCSFNKDEPVVTVTLDGRSQSIQLSEQTSVLDKIDFLLGTSPLEEREKWLERTGRTEE
jgi:hypothetical protein